MATISRWDILAEQMQKSCKGCKYLGTSIKPCDYILLTGNMRPCPPGDKCTVKDTGKKKRKKLQSKTLARS